MDRRLREVPPEARVTLQFEASEVTAAVGDSVAVALFAAGEKVLTRSVKYHRPRGLFCLAGHCGACLMRIDGKPNVRACRTPVEEGMRVERQNAFPTGRFDLLGAADFFFGKGMDHHTMMTSPRALNAVLNKVVRQLGGLGRLPDPPASEEAELPRARSRHVEVVVVGGGPAGLSCAQECAAAGRQTLLIDEQDRVGGSLLAHPRHGPQAADALLAGATGAGVEVLSASTALAWYPEDVAQPGVPPGLLAVQTPTGLLKLTADRYVYATGAYDQNGLFVDNDRPGVLPARAVGRLLVRFGLLPGRRPLVVGDGPYARALADALTRAGATVTRIDGVKEELAAIHGYSWVRAAEIGSGASRTRMRCDLVVVAALPAPASELPRQHGIPVAFAAAKGGFYCKVDARGASARPALFACGDVTGVGDIAAASASGVQCAQSVIRSLEAV